MSVVPTARSILNEGTFTGLSGITLSGNSAWNGGGILNGGTLTLAGSILSENSAEYGGGIYNDGTLTISDSVFSKNTAFDGGGIYNAGTLTMHNSASPRTRLSTAAAFTTISVAR